MVYGSGLENQRTRKGTVSSNLTLSANIVGVGIPINPSLMAVQLSEDIASGRLRFHLHRRLKS